MTDRTDEILRGLGRLEGKVDALATAAGRTETRTTERLDRHSQRLGALERSRARLIGWLAAAGSAGGLGLTELKRYLLG